MSVAALPTFDRLDGASNFRCPGKNPSLPIILNRRGFAVPTVAPPRACAPRAILAAAPQARNGYLVSPASFDLRRLRSDSRDKCRPYRPGVEFFPGWDRFHESFQSVRRKIQSAAPKNPHRPERFQ